MRQKLQGNLTYAGMLPNKMSNWRLILSGENDPYTNMAIDEAILTAHRNKSVPPTLRFYGWKPAGISLGYFQKADKVLNISNCDKDNIPFVRRVTAGQAVFHKDEITYSIICSRSDLTLPSSIKESFKMITSFLILAYKQFGQEAYFFSRGLTLSKDKKSTFCFAQSQDFDIAVNSKKIGGNAQKRLKNIIFQHGSIPLRQDLSSISSYFREDLTAIEDKVASLEELLGRYVSFDECVNIFISSFKQSFAVKLIEDELTIAEKNLAHMLKEGKYSNKLWNTAEINFKNLEVSL